jgi:hypothetical protein
LTRVWPDTVVEENNLVVQISALRKALGEDRDFIRTVSGRGYRFVAEIRTSAAATNAETRVEGTQSTPPSKLPTTVSSLIGRETEHEEISDLPASVVDITDASSSSRRPSPPLDWRRFASALARALVAAFSRILCPRNQASPKIRSIARELNVEAVVEGTVLRFDRVRIAALILSKAVRTVGFRNRAIKNGFEKEIVLLEPSPPALVRKVGFRETRLDAHWQGL